jgi:prefoldin subunit 5
MVDQEVADILAEIRDKVRASNSTGLPRNDSSTNKHTLQSVEIEPQLETNGFAGLTVLSRAWDRLPPLVTNRTGTLAQLDLWLKRKLKVALRWITWEQVNFNAATHQTFIEVIDALQQQKNYLSKLQEQMAAEFHVTRDRMDSYQQELDLHQQAVESQRAEFLQELRTRKELIERQQNVFSTQIDSFGSQLASFNALQSDLRARLESLNEQQSNSESNLEALKSSHIDRIQSIESRFVQLVGEFHELVGEFRGRDERLFDEHRVSLKQFSLELSESQVLQDRARRELEMRLAKLEKHK